MAKATSQFSELIYSALDGNLDGLPRERDDAVHDSLIRFFRTLSASDQRAFAASVSEALSHIPPYLENAKKFVTLLFVAQIAKSGGSRAIIRKMLSDGVLEAFVADQVVLKTHLIVTAAKYGLDQWLIDFIFRSSQHSRDVEYKLNCLRVLSWALDSSCADFLAVLVPAITEDSAKMLARTLEVCMKRLGCRSFLRWLHQYSDAIAMAAPVEIDILKSSLLTSAQRLLSGDIYAKLISIELLAEKRAIGADEIANVASLPPLVDEKELEMLLMRIRRSAFNPWSLIPKQDVMARVFHHPEGPVLVCGRTRAPLSRQKQAPIIARLDRSLTMSLNERPDTNRRLPSA